MSPTITDPAASLERAYELHGQLVERIQRYEADGLLEAAAADRRSLRSTRAMISQLTVRLGGDRPTFEPVPRTKVRPRVAAPISPVVVVEHATHGARFWFDEGEWVCSVDGVELYRNSLGYKVANYAREHGIVFPAFDWRSRCIDVTVVTPARKA